MPIAPSTTFASTDWGGNDTINASRLHAGVIGLTLDGGDDNDLLTGSAGADTIIGGRGADVAFMGAGDDTFVWNPGDGSDVVDGPERRGHLAIQRRQRQRED